MNMIDAGVILIILLFIVLGLKKGVIKSTVRLVGVVVIAIISFLVKTPLANFLIGIMPFFDFGGVFEGLNGMSILFYHGISFIFVFIMLYSILNILLNIAGILDTIVNATIILAVPNKILGAIVGFVEGVIISFLIIFALVQIPQTQNYVLDSMYANQILQRTPVIRTVLANITLTATEINDTVDNYDEDDKTALHIKVLNIMIKYKIITAEEVQDLIDDNKIDLKNVEFN